MKTFTLQTMTQAIVVDAHTEGEAYQQFKSAAKVEIEHWQKVLLDLRQLSYVTVEGDASEGLEEKEYNLWELEAVSITERDYEKMGLTEPWIDFKMKYVKGSLYLHILIAQKEQGAAC